MDHSKLFTFFFLDNKFHFIQTKKNLIFLNIVEAVEVKKHIQRMSNSACSVPSPRLIYIRQEHHGPVGRTFPPNVRYLPECTWLHRCGDDAGCCLDESKTCSAANIQTVSLPFFVSFLISFFFCVSLFVCRKGFLVDIDRNRQRISSNIVF